MLLLANERIALSISAYGTGTWLSPLLVPVLELVLVLVLVPDCAVVRGDTLIATTRTRTSS
eukprot:scaffold87002_cov35-Prasinocladus_malaysianus.AAC.1